MKLNKKMKAGLVTSVITDRYQSLYDDALKSLEVAARLYAIKNSHHESITSKLTDTELEFCTTLRVVNFKPIITECIPFLSNYVVSNVKTGLVYGTAYAHASSDDLHELLVFKNLVAEITNQTKNLEKVIFAYDTDSHLIKDLPWIDKYIVKPVKKSTAFLLVLAVM